MTEIQELQKLVDNSFKLLRTELTQLEVQLEDYTAELTDAFLKIGRVAYAIKNNKEEEKKRQNEDILQKEEYECCNFYDAVEAAKKGYLVKNVEWEHSDHYLVWKGKPVVVCPKNADRDREWFSAKEIMSQKWYIIGETGEDN